jgi:hypothetical protein
VVKLTSGGALAWTDVIELASTGPNQDCLVQCADGGWLVSGTSSGNNSVNTIFAVKLDANGNVSWAKNLGTGIGYSVIKTNDGGYAVAGITSSEGAGGSDILIVKLDANGNSCCSSDLSIPTVTTGGTSGSGGSSVSGGTVSSGNGVGGTGGGTKISQCN